MPALSRSFAKQFLRNHTLDQTVSLRSHEEQRVPHEYLPLWLVFPEVLFCKQPLALWLLSTLAPFQFLWRQGTFFQAPFGSVCRSLYLFFLQGRFLPLRLFF